MSRFLNYFWAKKSRSHSDSELPVESKMNGFGKEPFSKVFRVDIVSLVSKKMKKVKIYILRDETPNQMVFQAREWPSLKNCVKNECSTSCFLRRVRIIPSSYLKSIVGVL
jgi:hypothetical protein